MGPVSTECARLKADDLEAVETLSSLAELIRELLSRIIGEARVSVREA